MPAVDAARTVRGCYVASVIDNSKLPALMMHSGSCGCHPNNVASRSQTLSLLRGFMNWDNKHIISARSENGVSHTADQNVIEAGPRMCSHHNEIGL